ncbi:MAG: uL22 family ribosomal protein [Candidatus Shikimatogenerans sp. JK-2022]|nr:uL22 family ribosomal protein [Candidatus Shikimatogenerans bostrichidophilus]
MGKRKRISSKKIKENKKKYTYSLLNNVKISPRKIRLIVPLIKGVNVYYALNILENYISNKINNIFKNIILSAISNYINKYGNINYNELFIQNIIINNFGIKKKIKYASQGRCNIIKKRLSSIKIIINKLK